MIFVYIQIHTCIYIWNMGLILVVLWRRCFQYVSNRIRHCVIGTACHHCVIVALRWISYSTSHLFSSLLRRPSVGVWRVLATTVMKLVCRLIISLLLVIACQSHQVSQQKVNCNLSWENGNCRLIIHEWMVDTFVTYR